MRALRRAEAAGYFLLEFHHADIALGLIVAEGHIWVGESMLRSDSVMTHDSHSSRRVGIPCRKINPRGLVAYGTATFGIALFQQFARGFAPITLLRRNEQKIRDIFIRVLNMG